MLVGEGVNNVLHKERIWLVWCVFPGTFQLKVGFGKKWYFNPNLLCWDWLPETTATVFYG